MFIWMAPAGSIRKTKESADVVHSGGIEAQISSSVLFQQKKAQVDDAVEAHDDVGDDASFLANEALAAKAGGDWEAAQDAKQYDKKKKK